MALSAKQYREERAPLATKIREMAELVNNEGRDFTAEEQATWETLNTDYNQYTRSIELAERAERVIGEQEAIVDTAGGCNRRPGNDDVNHRDSARDGRREDRDEPEITDKHRNLALQGWCRAQYNMPLEKRHADACAMLGVRPHQEELDLRFRSDYGNVRREFRALSAVTDTAGAYLIPQGFVNSIEMAMLEFGGMREVADIMRTESGNDLPWPTSDDTSNEGALIGESVAVSEQDITVGQTVFHAYKYSSKLIKVPRELFEDAAFDIAGLLGPILGTRIARRTNRDFTTGDGAAKPKGVVTASGLGVTAASATAVTADEIISLVHSLDPAYRNGARFMLHDSVLMAVRKLKDGNGQYLWQPNNQAGAAGLLFGYPYTINQHMDSSIASGAKSMLFGQFSKYKIRDVSGFRLIRLRERYADNDQEGFMAFSRHDGNLLDAGTDPVKHMVH
jgi:HK97 family phage major capsid protein